LQNPVKVLASVITDWYNNLWKPKKDGQGWFYVFSSSADSFKEIDCLKAFEDIPEVNAVLSMKANLGSNGNYKVVNDKIEEQVDNPINKLLKQPNWFQAQKEFLMETILFHDIFGNEYIFPLTPFGFNFSPERVKGLFTLPPNLIEPKYLEKTPFFLFEKRPDGVKYMYKDDSGKEQELPGLVIHMNDNRVRLKSMTDKNLLKGRSKLIAHTPVINNMRAAYESRGVILESRGANGAWSPEGGKDGIGNVIPLEEAAIEKMQKRFADKYGTRKGQSQVIITDRPMKWVQAGVNDPGKLGLFEETKEGFHKLLDAFGMATELFARTDGSTYENQKQAEKGTYIRTVIPEANERAYALNKEFFPEGKLKIIADFSHLDVFQEDIKEKSEGVNAKINYLSKLLQDKQVSSEEYRAELLELNIGDGKPLPTQQDANQQEVETLKAQAALRGSVGGVQGVLSIQASVVSGATSKDSALSMLTIIYGFTPEQANQILGDTTVQSTSNNNEQE
jgi:hypothetical protein